MGTTTGVDLILAGFEALDATEREEAVRRILEHQSLCRDLNDSRGARCVASLKRVAEVRGCGSNLGVDAYRETYAELTAAGEKLEPVSRIIRHYGSWRHAKEGLALHLEGSSPGQIDARFAKRRLDKVWRYTEATLRETMVACVTDLGHVPQAAEFEEWRSQRLRLAEARGEAGFHIPSSGPYRRRYGSWEKALLALGYTPDQVAERLERGA